MRIGDYDVRWRDYGFSWAIPVIRERRRFLGFLWWRWARVDFEPTDLARLRSSVRTAHPKWLRAWFGSAIRQYEAYRDAWAAEHLEPKP